MNRIQGHIALLCLILCWVIASCDRRPEEFAVMDALPPIYPEYTDITIPCNIAPLNFLLRNHPSAVEVALRGEHKEWVIRTNGKIRFPETQWRQFLMSAKETDIQVVVTAKVNGQWIQYAPFRWTVVSDEIDAYLSYRFIEPGYEVWNKIQLRERHLESFRERVIADNNLTDNSCMNCHIYSKQNANLSFFHLRGQKGGTILNRNGELRKLHTQTGDMVSSIVYGELHPSGKYGIFSTNVIIPEFHTYRNERLEVYDKESDIYLLDVDKNTIRMLPDDDSMGENKPYRTFPVFSSDGNAVYYCEASFKELPDHIRDVTYNMLRVAFDADTKTFGEQVDTLFSAGTTRRSASYPKASPNGKYLLFTVSDYGTFPIWHQEAELQMLHLETGRIDSLPQVNAFRSDTYHSWSSSSRWFVFASKRDDGIYGKPYFSYIDSTGKAHKPFVLPQKDPAFYDYTLKSFNIPELSTSSLWFEAKDIEHIYQKVPAEIVTFEEPDRIANE